MWDLKQAPVFDIMLFQTYGDSLTTAIMKAYGINLKSVDWSSDQSQTVEKLLNNVWQFSAAKTYTQLKNMGEALVRPDGTIRDLKEFSIESGQIAATHLHWLKAERINAIGGAQMVALWEKIQAQKDIFQLLEFIAVIDKQTTELCGSLNGVIKPVDDPFWLTYFPLNHFGCRSTVKQLRSGKITPDDKIVYPVIPEMFRTNLGEGGLVFPEDHPYYKGMPDRVLSAARPLMPYQLQFDEVPESKDMPGKARVHFQLKPGRDYDRLLTIALEKARSKGTTVELMPTLNPDEDNTGQRSIIFPDARNGKSPDLRINGILAEEEFATRPDNMNNLKHAISAGARQANHVIVNLSNPVSQETMARVAKGRFIDHKNLTVIEFRFNGEYTVFNRPEKKQGQ